MKDNMFEDLLNDINGKEENEIVNHVVIIMDHSGSMNYQDRNQLALNNYNEQIQELKRQSDEKNQKTLLTLIEFSISYCTEIWEKDIHTIDELKDYSCSGSTALNDTIAAAIDKISKEVPELKDKSKNHAVLFIIMTDGEENASIEFGGISGRNALRSIIKDKEKEGNYTFTFMGANLDVQKDIVEGMAFYAGNTMSFTSDVKGFADSRVATNSGIVHYYETRSSGGKNVDDFYNTGRCQ